MRHEQEELLIDYYNGHLAKHEQEAFELHLQNCRQCQTALTEMEQTLGELSFLTRGRHIPEGLKERTLEIVPKEPDFVLKQAAIKQQPPRRRKAIKRKTSKLPAVMAFFLFIVAALYIWQQQKKSASEQTAALFQETSVLLLEQSENGFGEGAAAIVQSETELRVSVKLKGLKELRDEQVYQVWLVKGEQVVRAGQLLLNQNGQGTADATIAAADYDVVAVSIEPDEESKAAQGPVILSASLQ